EEVNLFYNRARVVLNIHQEHQKLGANPRVFEICGSGAYQVCDANPYVESLFGKDGIGIYHNEEELISCIQTALSRNMQVNAANAHQITLQRHTFAERIQKVLAVVGNL
ncbi:MAG: glycosyltransferase, partial [Bacteroidales bacterium]|nr:glycosyltransferase [Bacteroidales bacterium]